MMLVSPFSNAPMKAQTAILTLLGRQPIGNSPVVRNSIRQDRQAIMREHKFRDDAAALCEYEQSIARFGLHFLVYQRAPRLEIRLCVGVTHRREFFPDIASPKQ
jgi:hypothetical protein